MTLVFKERETYLIIVRGSLDSLEEVRAGLFQAYKASKLRSETITEDYAEIVYQVKFKDETDVNAYEDLKKIEGVHFVNMVAQSGETLG